MCMHVYGGLCMCWHGCWDVHACGCAYACMLIVDCPNPFLILPVRCWCAPAQVNPPQRITRRDGTDTDKRSVHMKDNSGVNIEVGSFPRGSHSWEAFTLECGILWASAYKWGVSSQVGAPAHRLSRCLC